ncbi:MAG: mechanosensitive ion channel family protein [Clostridia bacterium]|nr:mechanosensitive ion channel family protein [Clostridia bacterium]
MDWNQIWLSVQDFFVDKAWPLINALLILFFGAILVKIILVVTKRAFARSKMEVITQTFINNVLKYALYIMLFIIVLQSLGVPATTFIAVLSAMGLAIGLALKDSLSNLANGIIIIGTKPFKVNDLVNVNGVEGRVKSIQILTTTLTTKDNKEIILPNSDVLNKPMINYSTNPTRRVDFHFVVARETDIRFACETIRNVMTSDGRTLTTPAPSANLDKIDENGLDIFASCWCDNEDYWDVYYYVNENVFSEFNRLGIRLPYQQTEIRIRDDQVNLINYGELQPRQEKIREVNELSEFEKIIGIDFDKKREEHRARKRKRKSKKKTTTPAQSDDNTE